jgi:hypothetical protein
VVEATEKGEGSSSSVVFFAAFAPLWEKTKDNFPQRRKGRKEE